MPPLHNCPGECGRKVRQHLLACRPCWFRLPQEIRASVWQSYRSGGPGSVEHNTAVSAAVDWYATHRLRAQHPADTTAHCGSCGKPIRWVTTEATGDLMPLDLDPTPDGNVIPIPQGEGVESLAHVLRKDEVPPEGTRRFTAHWVTCPNADQHRRRA